MILHEIRRPNSLKTVPSGVTNCRNLPFGGRATRGSRVRLPKKEGTRSRHQRLFEENVRKTKICGLRTLIMKGLGVAFMHGEGISTRRVRHKGWKPLIKCANMTSKCFIFPFLCLFVFLCFLCFLYFLSFWGRQGCFPRSYVSSIVIRKSDLRSSFRTKRWLSCFDLFPQDGF